MFELFKKGLFFISGRIFAVLFVTLLLLATGIISRYLTEQEQELEQTKKTLQSLILRLEQKNHTLSRLHHQILQKQKSVRQKELELAGLKITDYLQTPLLTIERAAELKTSIRFEQTQLDFLLASREELEQQTKKIQQEYNQNRAKISQILSSGKYILLKEWKAKGWILISGVIFLFFLLPLLFSLFLYFLLFPLLEKIPQKSWEDPGILPRTSSGIFYPVQDKRSLSISIAPGETLFVRTGNGNWGKVRHNVKVRSRVLWNWKAPLISLASNLTVPNCYQ